MVAGLAALRRTICTATEIRKVNYSWRSSWSASNVRARRVRFSLPLPNRSCPYGLMGEMERIPMSHVTIVNRSQLFAAATAISAVGFLTIPTPAQAHPMLPLAPACSQYSFPDGDWPILMQNIGSLVITTHHGANAAGRVTGKAVGNVTSGGIYSGGRNVDFTITFSDTRQTRFTGTVGDDGLVHLGVANGWDNGGTGVSWDSTRPLDCADAPPPAPAQQPAPPAQTAAARLGVAVNGPTTLAAGQSGIYTVNLSNSGDTGAPVELYVSFGGNLQQSGQVTPSGGVNCEVINNAGGTTSVHCTVPQFQSKATANIVVQGRGSAPGAGHLTVNINSSDPGAQFVQKSQGLNVSIT